MTALFAASAHAERLSPNLSEYLQNLRFPESYREQESKFRELADMALPERPLTDQEGGRIYALRAIQRDLSNGAHRAIVPSVSLPNVPGVRPLMERVQISKSATMATRGGRFFSGAFKGLGGLAGRLVAPALFAMDVFSEEDKGRGVAKATGGITASSLGWMAGSAIGAGLGTFVLPGAGSLVGYYAGGALGAAAAYGWGRVGGTAAYNWLERNYPEELAATKKFISQAGVRGKELLGSALEAARTHGPGYLEKAKNAVGGLFASNPQ